ncbi:uncharacterized protein LOC108146122 [Drosophila elegans]|uniref:uncharacterized protein LOC108146122 n=1 Tax=Drosophila elegans TaxID=30023 RepID=UPI0007E67486|nr:uncharacterized protein LOC108146122 [Drosophila elegans]
MKVIWILSSLLLSVICGATGEPSTTTEDPISQLDRETNENIQDVLNKYDRLCSDNQELSDWLDSLRMALKLDKKLVSWKLKSLNEFNAYNKERTKLDSAIDARIERLNNLLPTFEPAGACSKFYLKQREALKNAKQLNNVDKLKNLNENSKDCRDEPDYDNNYNYI